MHGLIQYHDSYSPAPIRSLQQNNGNVESGQFV